VLTPWPAAAPGIAATVAIDVLGANPGASKGDVLRLAHVVWNGIRDCPCGPKRTPLALALRDGGVNNILGDLEALLLVLLAAGSLRATLQRQRDALDAVLTNLDKIQPAGKGAGAA
jgi:hypothetical protein